nr:hypothetical protein [Paenibacillus hamazuiensis]
MALTTAGAAAYAADAPAQSAAPASSASEAYAKYKLTDLLDVEIKSVLSEYVTGGTRVGVVVRMTNKGTQITRVPDTYELRIKTSDGVEYTLQPSATNPRSIQPKTTQELSYMSVIDRTDTFSLTEVNWTDVDVYVYPKLETRILTVPVTDQTWKGSDTEITDKSMVKKWGETFKVLPFISPLEYTPVNINKEITDKGANYTVQLLVKNPGSQRETVPDFNIDGKTEVKVFSGKRAEQESIVLEAQEEKYIHYVISTELDSELTSLNVLTPEKFAQSGSNSVVSYNVGRVNIILPSDKSAAASSFEPYVMGKPMQFDRVSDVIHPDMEVSMVEFRMSDNEDEGSKNMTAKFKLTNKSDRPMAVPVFQADLQSADGYLYSGNRQNVTTTQVLPNSSLVIGYSFTLPVSETGQGLAIKIQDVTTAAPYKSTIAAYGVTLQEGMDDKQFTLYPFDVKVDYYTVQPLFNRLGNMTYSYKLRFDLTINRDPQVQVDAGFSKLQFEAYDTLNRLVATKQASLIGTGKLVTGENNIMLEGTTEQMERPITVKLYEVFTTPAGESKRLLGVYKS